MRDVTVCLRAATSRLSMLVIVGNAHRRSLAAVATDERTPDRNVTDGCLERIGEQPHAAVTKFGLPALSVQ